MHGCTIVYAYELLQVNKMHLKTRLNKWFRGENNTQKEKLSLVYDFDGRKTFENKHIENYVLFIWFIYTTFI